MRPTALRRSCRPVALAAAVAAAASAVLALTGCNALAQLRPDAESHAAARAAVADVSRGLYRYGADVIEDYARLG